jgi:opacity protein-like surface antigen
MKWHLLALILIPGFVHAQRWHVNVTGGLSNYSGDLQAKPFTLDQSFFAFGAGVQYDITRNFSAITNISLMQVGAADRFNKADLQFRNLSFQTKIAEWNLVGEYTFFDMTRSTVSPFIFAGIAGFYFDPFAFDSTGKKVYLRPLGTEGEGLKEYPGRKPYNQLQFAIPLGAGIKFRVSENIVLAYEIGFRKTFTDYLDDASTRYVDRTILLTEKGPKAVEMAYRGGEVKGGSAVYPPDGTLRASAKYKDIYYYTGIRVSVALFSRRNPYYGRGRIDCPKPVQ